MGRHDIGGTLNARHPLEVMPTPVDDDKPRLMSSSRSAWIFRLRRVVTSISVVIEGPRLNDMVACRYVDGGSGRERLEPNGYAP
jgi:hypothetical protein